MLHATPRAHEQPEPLEQSEARQHARVVRTHPLSLPDGYMSAAALVAAGVPKALAAQLASAREMASHALGRIRPGSARAYAAGASELARSDAGASLDADPDADDWADAGPASVTRAAQALPVAFSAWDTAAGCRLLSFVYVHDATGAPGPATVWLATQHTFTQIVRLPPSLLVAPGAHAEICALCIAMRQHRLRILAVVLVSTNDSRSLTLVEYDIASASVVGRATVSELQTAPAAHQTSVHASLLHNKRYIAIGWSATSPAGRSATIAVHAAGDLAAACAPIVDTAAPFPDRPPAFDLSGRLLAYASTAAPPHSDTGSSTLVGEEDPGGNILYQARTMGERMYHGASAGASGLAAALAATSPAASATPQSRSAPAAGSAFLTTPHPVSPGPTTSHGQVYCGTVHVVDLSRASRSKAQELSSASLVSAFRAAPTSPAGGAGRLACIKFNPTGELLATADTAGHQFHIYALKMRPAPARKGEDSLLRPEWLYVIYRGITSAQVAAMEWSIDSRLLHVLTKRGTTHTVALHPWGAPPSAKECVTGWGTNAHAYHAHFGPGGPRPMPLAASAKTSTSIERFLPVQEGDGTQADPQAMAGNSTDTQTAAPFPAGWPALTTVHDTPGHEARRVGLYQFNASRGDVVQHELLLSAHRPRNLFAIPIAPRGEADESQAQHGASYPRTMPTTGRVRGPAVGWDNIQSLRPLARSEAPHALWRGLSRPESSTDSTDTVAISPAWFARIQRASTSTGLGEGQGSKLGTVPDTSSDRPPTVAAAELHTYAKVPYAHATHAYLVPQFKYGTFAPSTDGEEAPLSACAAHMAPTVRTEVRIEPRVDPGELVMDDLAEGLAAAATKADWAYSRPLPAGSKTGRMTPYGRDVPIPSFPVGVPARSRTWAQHVSQGIPLGRFTAAAGAASAGAAAGLRAVSGAVGGAMGERLNRAALSLGRSAPTGLAGEGVDDLYAGLDSLDPTRGGDSLTVGSLDAPRAPSRCGASGLSKAETDDFVDGGIDPDWNPAMLGRGSDMSFSDSDDHSGHSGSAARSTSASSRPLRNVKGADIGDWGDEEADMGGVEEDDEVAWAMARGVAAAAVVPGEEEDDLGWDGLELSPDVEEDVSLGVRAPGSQTKRTFLAPSSGLTPPPGSLGGRNTSLVTSHASSFERPVDAPPASTGFGSPKPGSFGLSSSSSFDRMPHTEGA